MSFLPTKTGYWTDRKPRCKNLCMDESSINGSGYGRYNAKCRVCQKAFNSDSNICYCCKNKISRRKSVNNNLKHKENLIKRYE